MKVELLYFEGCPSHEALLPRVRRLLGDGEASATSLELLRVETDEEARRTGFLGSPTIRVEGRDVEPGADERTDFGMKCRIYRTESGLSPTPPDGWIVDALTRARDAA